MKKEMKKADSFGNHFEAIFKAAKTQIDEIDNMSQETANAIAAIAFLDTLLKEASLREAQAQRDAIMELVTEKASEALV